MMYLDLDEIDTVLQLHPLWGKRSLLPARFERSDFHGDSNLPLADCVRDTVAQHFGKRPSGPIRMLVNLRYWGINFNPLSTYYVFSDDGQTLETIIAEVHNTPWRERFAYVLSANDSGVTEHSFQKQFHVSPFNPLAMEYRWRSSKPSEKLSIHLENWQKDYKVMDATMVLKRREISGLALSKVLVHFPCMTVKVLALIYWQALRLWIKGVPYYNHPHNELERRSARVPQPNTGLEKFRK